ncbi:hypothetical protein ACFL03_08860, partial [Thermodesulfobacteriota bacterium]
FAGLSILESAKLASLKLESSPRCTGLRQFQFSSASGGFALRFTKHFSQNVQKASGVMSKSYLKQ